MQLGHVERPCRRRLVQSYVDVSPVRWRAAPLTRLFLFTRRCRCPGTCGAARTPLARQWTTAALRRSRTCLARCVLRFFFFCCFRFVVGGSLRAICSKRYRRRCRPCTRGPAQTRISTRRCLYPVKCFVLADFLCAHCMRLQRRFWRPPNARWNWRARKTLGWTFIASALLQMGKLFLTGGFFVR